MKYVNNVVIVSAVKKKKSDSVIHMHKSKPISFQIEFTD